jgi:hypothetical protein
MLPAPGQWIQSVVPLQAANCRRMPGAGDDGALLTALQMGDDLTGLPILPAERPDQSADPPRKARRTFCTTPGRRLHVQHSSGQQHRDSWYTSCHAQTAAAGTQSVAVCAGLTSAPDTLSVSKGLNRAAGRTK